MLYNNSVIAKGFALWQSPCHSYRLQVEGDSHGRFASSE